MLVRDFYGLKLPPGTAAEVLGDAQAPSVFLAGLGCYPNGGTGSVRVLEPALHILRLLDVAMDLWPQILASFQRYGAKYHDRDYIRESLFWRSSDMVLSAYTAAGEEVRARPQQYESPPACPGGGSCRRPR